MYVYNWFIFISMYVGQYNIIIKVAVGCVPRQYRKLINLTFSRKYCTQIPIYYMLIPLHACLLPSLCVHKHQLLTLLIKIKYYSFVFLQDDKGAVQKPIPEKKKWIHDPSSKYQLNNCTQYIVSEMIRLLPFFCTKVWRGGLRNRTNRMKRVIKERFLIISFMSTQISREYVYEKRD